MRAYLVGLTLDEVSLRVPVFILLHAFPLGYSSSNLVSLEVNWTPWASQPLPTSLDLEATAIIASEITRPFKGVGFRALYLAKRLWCQLVGGDDPQIPMDPLEFMLAPCSMTDAEYNSWRNSISYAEWLLDGLDYKEFSITCLIPSLIVQVYAQFFLLLFLFLYLVCHGFQWWKTCSKRSLLPESQLILHISLGRSMLMTLMALLETMSCLVIPMLWATIFLQTPKR